MLRIIVERRVDGREMYNVLCIELAISCRLSSCKLMGFIRPNRTDHKEFISVRVGVDWWDNLRAVPAKRVGLYQ